MKGFVLLVMLTLAGCATRSEPLPIPPPQRMAPVCSPPTEMTRARPEPARPQGDYSQKDAANYIAALHEWATQGWVRLDAVKHWSQDCVERERLRTRQPTGAE